jgi:phospholipid-binding lipoprotein MlaA
MRAKAASWTEQLGKLFLGAGLLCLPLLAQAASEDDPWESINRPIFTFNDTLDTYALKPLAQGYQAVTPQFL